MGEVSKCLSLQLPFGKLHCFIQDIDIDLLEDKQVLTFLLPFNLPLSQHTEKVYTANETLMWNYLYKNSSLGIFELVD